MDDLIERIRQIIDHHGKRPGSHNITSPSLNPEWVIR